MEDGRITDSQITASDHFTWINPFGDDIADYAPYEARLNAAYEDLCWATHIKDTDQWIQITFVESHFISGVVTKGYEKAWVAQYKVEYSEDGKLWHYIIEADTTADGPKVLKTLFVLRWMRHDLVATWS